MEPEHVDRYPDTLRAFATQWTVAALVGQTLMTRGFGSEAIAAARRQRCASLIEHARAHSPFYRSRWRHLPPGVPELTDLPVVTKRELMAAFDDWCTDRAVSRADVERFLASPANIGAPYRDRYLVWTSSGTTGAPGVFVQDAAALATYDALVSVQLATPTFAAFDWSAISRQNARAALVTADAGHFASIASWRRVARAKPWLDMRSFGVTLPLPELVAALNAFLPGVIASYPTVLALLADEQAAGRLRVQPASIWAGGEGLSGPVSQAIGRAFGCPVVNEYGASECLTLGQACVEGRVHVNSDWVVLEPVDEQYRPTPAGALSHTVLLTNLANRVQPIVRYDLGDRIRVGSRCGCGSPLPVIEIDGRRDDVVTLVARDGTKVRIVPLALGTVVEEGAGVYRFQIVQRGRDRLGLRLGAADRRTRGPLALDVLRAYLRQQGLPDVGVELEPDEPRPDTRDGKLRSVVGLPDPVE